MQVQHWCSTTPGPPPCNTAAGHGAMHPMALQTMQKLQIFRILLDPASHAWHVAELCRMLQNVAEATVQNHKQRQLVLGRAEICRNLQKLADFFAVTLQNYLTNNYPNYVRLPLIVAKSLLP